MGDESWFLYFIRKQNGMEWHHTILPWKKKLKRCPQPMRPWELSFGMLKDACRPSFCHSGKRQCCFGHSRSFIVLCVTNVQGRGISSCNMTTHGPTQLICAWWGFRRMTGNLSLPSTLEAGYSPLRPPCLWVHKGSDGKASTVWPMRQARKLSVVYDLLKRSSTTRRYLNL